MHRSFAAWLVGQPWRAFLVGAGLAMLSPQGFSPFALVASAAGLLVILVGEAPAAVRRGVSVAVASFGAAVGTLVSLGQPPAMAAGLAGLAFLGPALLAVLLRRTGSLTLCFQLAVLGIVALLLGVFAVLPDPQAIWETLLRQTLDSLVANGVEVANPDEMVAGFARTMWGAYAALTLLGTLSALFLARWWQSLLEQPGGFGSEYRELRLGRVLGIGAIAVTLLAVGLDVALIDSLAWVAVSALAFQGLAAAHRRKADRQMGQGSLVAIYVFLLVPLSAFIMVTLLAVWGAADNWRQSRGLAGA